jgi:chemotaxis response regulator CheB
MSEVANKIDKVRVLVVDDSAVIRRIISSALAKCDDIEVVGTAANGLLAISFLKANKVDVVTLDIEMPEMDGLTALNEIRKFERDLPAANRLDKMEYLWNMIDENKLKEASDYNYVKEQLFRKDDNDYENFKTATSHILQDGQKENASARSVLGNEDLLRTIDQYFRKSKRGGEKEKISKKKRTSKERRKNFIVKGLNTNS